MDTGDIWVGIIVPIIVGPICAYLMTLRNDYLERKYRRKREKYEEERDTVYKALEKFYWPVYLNLLYIEQYSYQLPIKNKFRYVSGSSLELTDESNDFFEDNVPKVTEIDLDNNQSQIINKTSTFINNEKKEIKSDSSSDNFEISIDIPIEDREINGNITEDKTNKRRNSKRVRNTEKKTIILDKKTLFVFEKNLNKRFSQLISIIEENIIQVCIYQNLNLEIVKFMKYAKVREIIQEGSPEREYNIKYFGVENNLKTLIVIIKEILDKLNEKYTELVNNPV